MRRLSFALSTGELSLELAREVIPFEALAVVGERANAKRPFLFVSRVLGKHLPVSPRVVRSHQALLANELPLAKGPRLVVGMAETATALGQGVADALAARGETVIYLQTTRIPGAGAPWFSFEEPHSHAPSLWALPPAPELLPCLESVTELIIVDDELTTGTTACNVSRGFLAHLPAVRTVRWAAFLSWVRAPDGLSAELGRDLEIHSLAQGTCTFERSSREVALPLPPVAGVKMKLIDDHPPGARRGQRPLQEDDNEIAIVAQALLLEAGPQPIDLIGVGEDMSRPLAVAALLEAAGADVVFRATTRSPIARAPGLDGAIAVPSPLGDGVPYYLYALEATAHRRRFLLHHSRTARTQDILPGLIGATPVVLGE